MQHKILTMKRLQLVVIFILLILSSCKKKSDSTDKIVFSGIVYTNDVGQILSAGDPTDWKFQDSWVTQENNLFTPRNLQLCNLDTNFKIVCYPNPCNGNFMLRLWIPNRSIFEYHLVDKNFNSIINKTDTLVPGQVLMSLNVKNDTAYNNELVRLYYKIIKLDSVSKPTCEYRGHGDILIKIN